MNLHQFTAAPPADLAAALERFEEQFRYPLGPGRSFRIAHGDDYPRFFRAVGTAACFVAERDGAVLGVLGAALRRLLLPCGAEQLVVYLGDLKISPMARGGRALPLLAAAARAWVADRAAAAFAVVMDGTRATPDAYSGRLGIPAFAPLGQIAVLRLPTGDAAAGEATTADEAAGAACYARLSAGRYASPGGAPAERSQIAPLWLLHPDGRACGRLEDTRRAKRLIADDGAEMLSAHLSCFACADAAAGAALVRAALRRAAGLGLPALFVAVADADAAAIGAALAPLRPVVAPATVFAAGLAPGPLWNVNTAEI